MAGHRAGRPVCELLSDTPRRDDRGERHGCRRRPRRGGRAGGGRDRRRLQLREAQGRHERRHRARVAAVRAAIDPHASLRLDANGAWSVAEAERILAAIGGQDLGETVEEPVQGLYDTSLLRERVAVRIAMDETAAIPGALTARVADAVCLKIARCGGIELLAAATRVRASGARSISPRPTTGRAASPRRCTPRRRSPRSRRAAWRRSSSSRSRRGASRGRRRDHGPAWARPRRVIAHAPASAPATAAAPSSATR